MSDTWYFAYGSNLSIDQKQARTGLIRSARVARLRGYRFAFNKRGGRGAVYANIMPSPADQVWGVVYLCNQQAMRCFDDYEGVDTGNYRRQQVAIETLDGQPLTADVYLAGDRFVIAPSRPSETYLQRILTGARQHGLPVEYIAWIEQLARAPVKPGAAIPPPDPLANGRPGMGSQVQASCACGYQQNFMIGGGISNSETMFAFPCLCEDCHRIVEVNLLDQSPTCPKCHGQHIVPYDNDKLVQRQGGSDVTTWREFTLTDDPHYCPQCDSFGLKFTDTGLCWD